jgi:8-oxo-dGTP pyrophosphatase MutT (NUDIX family)
MLAALVPFDDQEARSLKRIRALLAEQAEPFSRATFTPGHVTASGFIMSPDRTSLLLVKHRKIGAWLQPGGHVEPDDADVVATQRREIEEETGLTDVELLGLFDVDVHSFPRRGREPAHEHFDVRSAFVSRGWHVEVGDGADDVRWFSLDRIPRHDPSITRPVAKLLSL